MRQETQGRGSTNIAALALPPELREWRSVPDNPKKRTFIKQGASTVRRDNSAVPVEAVRSGLKRLAAEARWGSGNPNDYPSVAPWQALKRLVILVLLATVCPRIDHLRFLNVDDFAWHRFADGTVAWGLRFRGEDMKMRVEGEEYWIKLPDEMASIIRAWILCSEREIGQKNAPLLIARKSLVQR